MQGRGVLWACELGDWVVVVGGQKEGRFWSSRTPPFKLLRPRGGATNERA